jgi:hypothetical protein
LSLTCYISHGISDLYGSGILEVSERLQFTKGEHYRTCNRLIQNRNNRDATIRIQKNIPNVNILGISKTRSSRCKMLMTSSKGYTQSFLILKDEVIKVVSKHVGYLTDTKKI